VTRGDTSVSFRSKLETFENHLARIQYSGAFRPRLRVELRKPVFDCRPVDGVTVEGINSILSAENIGPPHGFDLLKPIPIPNFPKIPERPTNSPSALDSSLLSVAERLESKVSRVRERIERQFNDEAIKLNKLLDACRNRNPSAIRLLMTISHIRHDIHPIFRLQFTINIDLAARLANCTIEVPNFALINVWDFRESRGKAGWSLVSSAKKKRLTECALYSLCLRAAYLVARSDEENWFETVTVNAFQNWGGQTTGTPHSGIVASIPVTLKKEIEMLRFDHAEPKACFRQLKGKVLRRQDTRPQSAIATS
jgi:hypothetical protein